MSNLQAEPLRRRAEVNPQKAYRAKLTRAGRDAYDELIVWNEVVAAAATGARCPMNDDWSIGMSGSHALCRLARKGRLKIEISGKNWRTVEILDGEHAGKRTKEGNVDHHTYLIIDKSGSHPR